MRIAVPKVRNEEEWSKKKGEVKAIIEGSSDRLTFQKYCRLSLWFLEATNQAILSRQYEWVRGHLLRDDASFQELTRVPAEVEQGKKILGVLRYGWKNIFELLEGWKKQLGENVSDPLGIYQEESINMQFARLEEMVRELESKGFRTHDFMKENQYITESNEKEMKEELVFIKLLKNILTNQIEKLQQARGQSPDRQQQSEENQEEEAFDISRIVRASEYFQKKKTRSSHYLPQDPISRQEQNRIFNSQVLKYIQSAQRRF